MTTPTTNTQVQALARETGFDACGVARLDRVGQGDEKYLRQWISSGAHGTMAWMERTLDKRLFPESVLPGAKSVVCVALSYHDADSVSGSDAVAKYARGRDYHKIFTKRLKRFESGLADLMPGIQTRRYVDTGPVLEKYWAERAGLGWRGKHTNLVSREHGSWLLLGEILVTAELEPSDPETDHCGTCRSCVDACPTGAITGPYQLDSRLCISYLTIEHRGSIPRELRPKMGLHVFGCDICLDVCPWNKFSTPYTDRDFLPRKETTAPDLAALAKLNRKQFEQRFAGTPVMRARREGLVRNACIALGNLGTPDAVEALAEALNDESPLVREHAAWGLGRIDTDSARAALTKAHRTEADAEVLAEINLSLA